MDRNTSSSNSSVILEFETVGCPLCGSENFEVFAEHIPDRLQQLPGEFRLVRCQSCSLVYQNPRLSIRSLGYFYPEDYKSFTLKAPSGRFALRELMMNYGLWRRYQIVRSLVKGGCLLDVGCGTGWFLASMANRPGWRVVGIEPNTFAARYAQEQFGLDVINAFPDQLNFEEASFDVVTMWDVVEHLHNPTTILSRVRIWLKNRGFLIIRTPNLGSWDSRVFREFWAGLDLPRHLFVLDKGSLSLLLEKTGFRIIEMRTGTGSYEIFFLSLRYWLDEKVGSPRIRNALLRVWNSTVVRLISAPLFFTLDRMGLGAEIVAIAQPES